MTERISGATKLGDLSQDLVPEPDFGLGGYFAQNVSRIIESGTATNRLLKIILVAFTFYPVLGNGSKTSLQILLVKWGGGRVAELGSLSLGAKMAMQIFVKRVFTIFASNASFLRVIANLQN